MTDVLLTVVAGLLALLLGLAGYGIRRVDNLAGEVSSLKVSVLGSTGGDGLLHEVYKLRKWKEDHASSTLGNHAVRIQEVERDVNALQKRIGLS